MDEKAAKVIIWVFSLVGWIIVLLCSKDVTEDYGVKLYINQMLVLAIASIVLSWTVIVPLIVFILWIIGLVNIINDKDEPLPIIGNWQIIK